MITDYEKKIYNTYLRITRSIKNLPFTLRKDFDTLDATSRVAIHRIGSLLSRYPHITPDEYFTAPYKVYPSKEHFDIEFFAGQGAIHAFTIYRKQIQEAHVDSDESLKFIADSLKFIGSFCAKKHIQLNDYPTFKSGVTYDWMKHIKQYNISVYSLMEFSGINDIIANTPEDEKQLFLGDVGSRFLTFKVKYTQSQYAKPLVIEGLKKVELIIKKDAKI